MRDSGLRITPQRLAIAASLASSPGHHTVADVFNAIHDAHPTTDVTTVYRTLAALATAGLVHSTDGPTGTVFEWTENESHHHHMVCTTCGAEIEIAPAPVVEMSAILERDTGFRLTGRHYRFEGTCKSCR